ncbi:sugar phosphate isomerase/epimerase family protein [Micromonospora sp. DT81.3]|uniref:sugar phosphate isomerase/epimerase family protein n=1 Tax=Micromonospora sp. DT81.3 TaxID=3416523 RepID=UPI003CEEDA1E
MSLTKDDWPIAASLLSLGPGRLDGASSDREEWLRSLTTVRDAEFDLVDLTDSWLPYGDLRTGQRKDLREALSEADLGAVSLSAIRRSVIDEVSGDENLAYSHRTLDFAAELGVGVVSVGLHRPLTEEQRSQLWFWTAQGHRDVIDDEDVWRLAVDRFRELGRHAEEVGVLLSLELYEHTLLGSARSAVRLVESIGLDVVGLNPDVGNLIRLHEPVEDWRTVMSATLPYANFWHVKNYTRDENATNGTVTTAPSYLESGIIDYRESVALAVASGFQGVICTEHYGGDGLSMSAANRDYLRRRVLPRRPGPVGTSRVRQQFGEAR